jgi:hypothetical protein
MFPEYLALLTRPPKINVEYERLSHPIQFPPQITGTYTKCLKCGRQISGKTTELGYVSQMSDNNVLDWTSLFFLGTSNSSLWNRRYNFALVGRLDCD